MLQLLPKSITTAIGMGVSEELGGIVTITVAVIIITGVLGNMIAEAVCRIARINEPIAKGWLLVLLLMPLVLQRRWRWEKWKAL